MPRAGAKVVARFKPREKRVVDIVFPADEPSRWSTMRMPERIARCIRSLAKHEHRALNALLDDMLTLYVETKHPALRVVYEPDPPGDES
jgi:hypothetical protein